MQDFFCKCNAFLRFFSFGQPVDWPGEVDTIVTL